jgi:ubiquinol-cytochrome c reductase iron-sulfur subunit
MSNEDMSEANLPSEREHAHHGGVEPVGDPFADPGLPPHEPRRQDIDERTARRSERTVALLFTLSMIATVGFIASYVMSDEEVPDERHAIEATPEVREKVFADFRQGVKESQFGRRRLIRTTMMGALSLVPLSGIVLLRDLGPLPEKKLRTTAWRAGMRLINQNTNEPLRPEDIGVGSLTFAKPEGLSDDDEDFQNVIAKAALMIVRLNPQDIKDKRELEWSHQGIVAYSKICTHVGCPISLYEQQTHHVLCPCHQSTFDLSDGGRVIFGPAGHALPQLRISVNEQGYLEALGDFEEPVGPSFWERG